MVVSLTDKPIFDEMLGSQGDKPSVPRTPYSKLQNWLDNQKLPQLRRQSDRAQDIFRSVGITFNVYGDGDGVERLIPFDMVPRIITSKEWKQLEKGYLFCLAEVVLERRFLILIRI